MQFNSSRFKLQLKLAVNRLKLLQQKKAALNATQRREIATLLEIGKEESARVRVEPIIREDFIMEAFELLEIFCELLLARFGLIETMPLCDSVIKEAVCSLIYASPRCDLKELHNVRDLLALKYGKEFVATAIENKDGSVNQKVIQKLKVDPPSPTLVSQYLIEIARAYQVDWTCTIPEPEPNPSQLEKISQGTSSSDIPVFMTSKSIESAPPYTGMPVPNPTAPLLAMDTYRFTTGTTTTNTNMNTTNPTTLPPPPPSLLNNFSHSQPLSFEHGTLVNPCDFESNSHFLKDMSMNNSNDQGQEKRSPGLDELSMRLNALKERS